MDENERRLHRRQLSADWQRQFEQQRFRQRGRLADRVGAALARLNNPDDTRAMRLVALLCFVMDACLCFAIVKRVPYTEVDWTAYMEQVDTFAAGERDYSAIHGGTGPLVYPAGHVYVFRTLQAITRGGDIQLAQRAFGALYLVNLALGLAVYVEGRLVPPWALPLLVLSKRLHSIFLLRLFNDGVAMFFAFASVLLAQKDRLHLATLALSAAACIAGNDREKQSRLPDTSGMKNEILLQEAQKYVFDRYYTIGGGKLVLFGNAEGANEAQWEAAFVP